ncbi:unnamed protein product, partial [marine sediment metagenome]
SSFSLIIFSIRATVLGKKVGDIFDIKKNDILIKKYKIVKIENKYIHAYNESISEFETSFLLKNFYLCDKEPFPLAFKP